MGYSSRSRKESGRTLQLNSHAPPHLVLPPFSPALTYSLLLCPCVGQMFLQLLAPPCSPDPGHELESQTLTDWEFTLWRGEDTA